jgi:hypothetical protein
MPRQTFGSEVAVLLLYAVAIWQAISLLLSFR